MNKKKVVFFADNLQEHVAPIKAELSKSGHSCFSSNNPDEMNQTFQQSGKFIIFFADAQEAVKFLQKSPGDLTGIEYKVFAYINKTAKFSAESQKILDRFRINVYLKNEADKLLKSINDYFTGNEGDAFNIDDLQFIMPKDD